MATLLTGVIAPPIKTIGTSILKECYVKIDPPSHKGPKANSGKEMQVSFQGIGVSANDYQVGTRIIMHKEGDEFTFRKL